MQRIAKRSELGDISQQGDTPMNADHELVICRVDGIEKHFRRLIEGTEPPDILMRRKYPYGDTFELLSDPWEVPSEKSGD